MRRSLYAPTVLAATALLILTAAGADEESPHADCILLDDEHVSGFKSLE